MSHKKNNLAPLLLIAIISVFSVLDLFIHVGRSANMDGLVHITTAAQYTDAFKSGDFPVMWLDGFANYGMPIGMFSQQATSYLGMFFNLFTNDPVLAYNIVAFIGILLSNVFFYYFLRLYFEPKYAFLGTFLFNFAPFRIIDLYIRGAIPETFSTILLPLTLISIYHLIQKKSVNAFFLMTLCLAGIIITHPMMFVTYAFLFIPYFLFNVISVTGFRITKKTIFFFGLFFFSIVFALGLTGWYIIPLTQELKYFYYGSEKNHLVANQFVGLINYFDPNWYYFYKDDIFSRGHFIQSGLIETIGVLIGLIVVVTRLIKGSLKKQITLLDFAVVTGLIIIFFTTQYSESFYKIFSFLGNIQFPWRMFSAFIFIPPIIIIALLSKFNKNILIIAIVLLVCITRFPQLYGKNFTAYPQSTYTFTTINLHSNNMNTIWTGETETYPVKKEQIEIVGGEGKILSKTIKNSSRMYTIEAKTPLHIVDYTFYFPGWTLYVDGQKQEIQFQDPNYRGVITYTVPAGKHDIKLQFEDTKVRILGKVVSLIFVVIVAGLFITRKRLMKIIIKSK